MMEKWSLHRQNPIPPIPLTWNPEEELLLGERRLAQHKPRVCRLQNLHRLAGFRSPVSGRSSQMGVIVFVFVAKAMFVQ